MAAGEAAISFRKDNMKAQFVNLQAAADFMGPGAIEIDRYQTEITDIVRRRGPFGQRIKNVPATGHPSRFFEETAIPAPTAANGFVDPRNIVPDAGLADPPGAQRSAEVPGLADQLQPVRYRGRRAAEPVCVPAGQGPGGLGGRPVAHPRCVAVERQRHLAEHSDHAAVLRRGGQIDAGGNVTDDRYYRQHCGWIEVAPWRRWCRTRNFEVRPTAIYANPVLLDLIDREMKPEFNVVLSTTEVAGGLDGEDAVHSGGRPAADSRMVAAVHRHSGQRPGGASRLHRDRRHDRVSLADRAPIRASSNWDCRARWPRRWWW